MLWHLAVAAEPEQDEGRGRPAVERGSLGGARGMPRIDGCPYPFTSNGITPINSFGDPKRLLESVPA